MWRPPGRGTVLGCGGREGPWTVAEGVGDGGITGKGWGALEGGQGRVGAGRVERSPRRCRPGHAGRGQGRVPDVREGPGGVGQAVQGARGARSLLDVRLLGPSAPGVSHRCRGRGQPALGVHGGCRLPSEFASLRPGFGEPDSPWSCRSAHRPGNGAGRLRGGLRGGEGGCANFRRNSFLDLLGIALAVFSAPPPAPARPAFTQKWFRAEIVSLHWGK